MNQTRQAWQACGWELSELVRRHLFVTPSFREETWVD